MCVYINMNTYIHIYIYIHIHTYIHIFINTLFAKRNINLSQTAYAMAFKTGAIERLSTWKRIYIYIFISMYICFYVVTCIYIHIYE